MRYARFMPLAVVFLAACADSSPQAPNAGGTVGKWSDLQQMPNTFRYLAEKDPKATAMVGSNREHVHHEIASGRMFHLDPVPRLVHRVLGSGEATAGWPGYDAWAEHGRRFGYTLLEWTPYDVISGKIIARQEMVRAVREALLQGREDVAMQLTGIAVLHARGGLVVGPHARPPTQQGEPMDLDHVVHMKGLTVTSNLRARAVGGVSVYLTNQLLAAPAGNPWVEQISYAAPENVLHLLASQRQNWPSRYFAGNAFLSRELAGFFHVLPFTSLQALGMLPNEVAQDGDEDALE